MNDLSNSPAVNRHDPASGAAGSGVRRISTRDERPGRRFEYWRSLHPNIDLDVAGRRAREDFRAELLHCAGPDGSSFGVSSFDDNIARFGKRGPEFILFSLTVSGSAKLTDGNGGQRILAPSHGVVALDSTCPLTTESSRQKHVYLTVPRAKIVRALGDNPEALPHGFLALPSYGIAALLNSHLLMIANEGNRLDEGAMAVAVRCSVDLAIEALAQGLEGNGHALRERPSDTTRAAARRYVQLHYGDSALTTARVAHAIGCSRAHLHRIFAEEGEQLGALIRRTRLEAACRMLTSSPALPIGQVAHSCGFDNASSFSRAFRDFVGASPSAYRGNGA